MANGIRYQDSIIDSAVASIECSSFLTKTNQSEIPSSNPKKYWMWMVYRSSFKLTFPKLLQREIDYIYIYYLRNILK